MAAPTAANVLVGSPNVTGGVCVGPPGTALPTDPTTDLNSALVATGYISEDGVTQAIETDTEDIVAWGGDTVRVIQTTHTLTYQFQFLETNDTALKVVYGDENVATSETGLAALINSKPLPHKVYVLEIKDGDRPVRVVIPDGQVTERGELVYVHTDAVKYDVTITAYPDAAGNKAYIYYAPAAAQASAPISAPAEEAAA
jgi:hypothetical protein